MLTLSSLPASLAPRPRRPPAGSYSSSEIQIRDLFFIENRAQYHFVRLEVRPAACFARRRQPRWPLARICAADGRLSRRQVAGRFNSQSASSTRLVQNRAEEKMDEM